MTKSISVAPFSCAWIAQARALCTEFKKSGDVSYAQNRAKRYAGCCLLPVCCFPCIMWSTLWRCVACPWMCMCKGAAYSCSDNGCTQVSDLCITEYYDEIHQHTKLDTMPDAQSLAAHERAELAKVLKDILSILESVQFYSSSKHYRLVDALFRKTRHYSCTPASAKDFVRKMIDNIETPKASDDDQL